MRELEDVDRAEAEALGLIEKNAPVPSFDGGSGEKDFNDGMEASVEGWSPYQISTLKSAFGDQVKERDGKVQWQGNLIADLADEINSWGSVAGWPRSFDNKEFKGRSLKLGSPSDAAMRKAAVAGRDLSGAEMILTPDNLYHHLREHGDGRERDTDQHGLVNLDLQVIPHVWRDPDRVEVSEKKGTAGERSLVMWKKVLGRNRMVAFDKRAQNQYYPTSYLSKRNPEE